jgi:bacteriorhodopsin
MNKVYNFLGQEVLNLAIGYLAGLAASNMVAKFFVKRGLVNLWGVAASRDALKKDTYEWVMFIASYLIGLLVMVAVQYGMRRLRGQTLETED